jgi:hypothetical protein
VVIDETWTKTNMTRLRRIECVPQALLSIPAPSIRPCTMRAYGRAVTHEVDSGLGSERP